MLTSDINTETPDGRLLFRVFTAFDELRHELILENTGGGLAAAETRQRGRGRRRMLDNEEIRVAEAMIKDTVNYPCVGNVIDHLKIGRTAFYRYFPADRIRSLRCPIRRQSMENSMVTTLNQSPLPSTPPPTHESSAMKVTTQTHQAVLSPCKMLQLKELLSRSILWADNVVSDPRVQALNLPYSSEIPKINDMICELLKGA